MIEVVDRVFTSLQYPERLPPLGAAIDWNRPQLDANLKHPQDCDCGEVATHPFSPSVNMPIDEGASAAIAEFNQRGISTMVLLLTHQDELQFKTFVIFPDGSSRTDYHTSGHLIRQ